MDRSILWAGAAAALLTAGANAAENLTAETTNPGSTAHLSITHVAEIAAREGIADLQVQDSMTLTNSILNVANGTTDIASAPAVLPFLLKIGRGPYAKVGDDGEALHDNLRAMWPYSLGTFALSAYQSSGITGYDQLEGKTIYNGPPSGGALNTARQIIQVVTGLQEGEGYEGLQVGWGAGTKTVLDGSSDANLLPGSLPSDRVIAAVAAGTVNLISIPKDIFEGEAFQKYVKSPGNAPVVIESAAMGYGEGVNLITEDEFFRGVGIPGFDLVHKDMDPALAKSLTAAYIESLDELRNKTPYAGNMGAGELAAELSGMCGAVTLTYHPGAIEAWEEAGYTVPECAKP